MFSYNGLLKMPQGKRGRTLMIVSVCRAICLNICEVFPVTVMFPSISEGESRSWFHNQSVSTWPLQAKCGAWKPTKYPDYTYIFTLFIYVNHIFQLTSQNSTLNWDCLKVFGSGGQSTQVKYLFSVLLKVQKYLIMIVLDKSTFNVLK